MNTHTTARARQLATRRPNRLERAIAGPFHKQIDKIDDGLEFGTLEAMLPDGSFRILGARGPGPLVKVDLKSWRALVRLARHGSVGWYEAWEKGEWSSPDPVPLFDLFMRNRRTLGNRARASGIARLAKRIGHALRRNHRSGAKRNIMAHYDLGNRFYAAWLDPTMSYSSAIFADPISREEPLEAAQTRKVGALIERLHLQPASRVLEIGCGWGHVANRLARQGHDVVAITLSPSQKRWAEKAAEGLPNPPNFALKDYRDVRQQYDAIVSVEMVEAVGQRYWPDYLRAVARALKPGGRAAIQYIMIADDIFERYAASADFIQTYIFPGGMLLSESRFRSLADKAGLDWEAPQHFGLHYAETLKRWRARFDAAYAAVIT
jgi:cyclopropane-fatty-acyl-phospholipid synthase